VRAHAFGERYELPIPLLLFVLGGAFVVVVSFLLVMSRTVREDEPDLPDGPPAMRIRPIGAALSFVLLAALVACGLLGSQETAENLLPTVFWLLVWIAVPLSCGLLGDWTRGVNPFAVLGTLADRPALRRRLLGSPEPVGWPRWLGWWPAVALYFLLACGELVFNLTATLPRVTAAGLALYALVSGVAGMLFGQSWLRRGEVFSVLFSTWGKLGYFRFGASGRRGFAGGLVAPFERSPSRVSFVLMLLISVNFDGLLATPGWTQLERRWLGPVAAGTARLESFRVVSFVLVAVVVSVIFGAFATGAVRVGRHGTGPLTALNGLLPSLLPIAFGYLLAHNVQYLLVNAQLLFPLIGNPVGLESWPIHLAYPFNDSYQPNVRLLPSAFYWYVAVAVIVAVHVVAVVLAHRHLGRDDDQQQRARGSELPWLAAMVGYTMVSLWLLAQPLVQEQTEPGGSAEPATTGAAIQSVASVQLR
jgi:heme/copper-type cytochrome/quinol oxidase subunit 2